MMMYHGTRTGFRGCGGLLLPSAAHKSSPRAGNGDPNYVYFTPSWNQAVWYAKQGKGRGRARVLTVEPCGKIEIDPSTYDGEEDQYRCEAARVVSVTLLE